MMTVVVRRPLPLTELLWGGERVEACRRGCYRKDGLFGWSGSQV
jgi:hypothetical protein